MTPTQEYTVEHGGPIAASRRIQMEKIGAQEVWSYFGQESEARVAENPEIGAGQGHSVSSYFELARKVAELQFRNRDYVLLFRGQRSDHRTSQGNTAMHATIFRLEGRSIPRAAILTQRFDRLKRAESELLARYNFL